MGDAMTPDEQDKNADKPEGVQQPPEADAPAPTGTNGDTDADGDRDYGGQDAGAEPVMYGDAKFGPADGYPDDAYIDLPHESGSPDPEPLTYDDLGPDKKYVPGESEKALAAEAAATNQPVDEEGGEDAD